MTYEQAKVGLRVRDSVYGSGTILRKYIETNGTPMIVVETDGDGDPNYSVACEKIHTEPGEWELIDA